MDSFIVHSHFNWNIKWEKVLGRYRSIICESGLKIY